MDIVAARPMTLARFLAWEEQQEERHEFDGEQPVPMTGGTIGHGIIVGNIFATLLAGLRGTGYRPYAHFIKVTPPGRSRYPDVFVSSAPVVRTATVDVAPVVIFEVLSPSTRRTDRKVKRTEYQTLPTLMRYVMVEPDRFAAISVRRAGAEWIEESIAGAEAVLDMPEIGARLLLADIYDGLDLD